MDTLDQLLAGEPIVTGASVDAVQELFSTTFETETLDGQQEGSIIYLVGRVGERNVKINVISAGGYNDWIVNGVLALRTGPLGAPVEERRRLLRQAIARIPTSPAPTSGG